MGTVRQRNWQREVLGGLRGQVLDVGAGEGAAATYLPATVTWFALEPVPGRGLNRVAAGRPHSVVLPAPAERIPLPERSVDAVVCSTVLCSVRDQGQALREIRRVLRPGGRLVFFEHVGARQGTGARRVQGLLSPFTRAFGGGCDPRRDTESALRAAGFVDLDVTHAPVLDWQDRIGPTIAGSATVG